MNWVKCIFFSTMYSGFKILTQCPEHWGPVRRGPTVLRAERPEVKDLLCTMISDSKGLFDALNNELPQDDRKSANETPIIEEQMRCRHGRCRWVPHNYNPADALT
eukprot:1404275-Karenia_brevis.AAC.1